MFFSDQITLREGDGALDDWGNPLPAYSDVIVFANKKSATRSEFYSAHTAGIKIDLAFEVHVEDYGNQNIITYDSTDYNVIRAYQKGKGIVELTCAVREVG